MRGTGHLLGIFTVTYVAVCATTNIPGDAERGKELFRTQNCIACHSVNGEGGSSAPDLGRSIGRGYGPSQVAGLMWNHAPVMWTAMEKKGLPRPQLGQQEAADLFAFFFSARYFDKPGEAGRGKQLFQSKHCADCHGIASPARQGIKPVAAWQSLRDPIGLAQQMWNHFSAMQATVARQKIAYPQLTSQDITDLLVYLQNLPQTRGRPTEFSPDSAETGQALFKAKGCAGCHHDQLAFENRHIRYTLTDFAASMWNHAPKMRPQAAELSYAEMRRLVGYLCSVQFFDERGSPERGKAVFEKNHCATCHGDGSLSGVVGKMTSFLVVEALWKHGPTMLARMQQQKLAWPRFSGSEMADLTAFLNGPPVRRRPARD